MTCDTGMIHPTAILSPTAKLGKRVKVGPYCVIGDHVILGDDCVLHSHVVLEGYSEFGEENEFFPFAVIGGKSQDLKYQGEPTRLFVGARNVFRENSTVHRGTTEETPTRIGNDNLFLAYSHIAHDCQVGSHVILSNNGTLAGHVVVEDYAIISGLTAVHQFCRVGCHSITGGCTKVVQDIPPYMIVDGNPGETRALNVIGLQRRGFSDEDVRALKNAYKKLFLKKEQNLKLALEELKQDEVTLGSVHVAHLVACIENSARGISR